MSAPITIPAVLDGANRKKDKSISLRFVSTLEVSTEDYMQVDHLLGQAGYCLFSPNELKLEDIPKHDAPTEERKSKAQRLRGVIYLYWKSLGSDLEFEAFYDREFERVMNYYKEKL